MADAIITVEVHAQREGSWWVLRMDDGATQVKSLGDVDEMVADYVSLMRDVPADVVRVDLVSIDPGFGMATRVLEAKRARDEADRAQRAAARAVRETAKALKDAGLAGIEVARVLGVSPQRVSQLTSGKLGAAAQSTAAEAIPAKRAAPKAVPPKRTLAKVASARRAAAKSVTAKSNPVAGRLVKAAVARSSISKSSSTTNRSAVRNRASRHG